MAGSKRIRCIQKTSSADRATGASAIATERVEFLKSIHNLKMPIRNLFHRLNHGSAAQRSLPSRGPYQYTPLSDDLKEIRLLTLHEGRFKADIHISIHTVPLTTDSPPIYEALSYVWGSPETPIDIQVGVQTLSITRSLAEALPYLRYRDRPRILWIDAICVNQQDLEERSRQIRRMADLYRLAERVVVWLGPGNKDSSYGLRLLKDLSSQITVDWVHQKMKPRSNGTAKHWAEESEELPYGHKQVRAVYSLISRPWFERLWIWQEIQLAKSNAIVICGSDPIPWESCRSALFCLYWKKEKTSVISEQFSARVKETYHLASTGGLKYPLQHTMHTTRYCKYTDPKDRVYAILSLLDPSDDGIDIEPDYTKSTSQVFQNVALHYINHHKTLELLSSSGLSDRQSEMPTWVPDWTVIDYPHRFANGLASLGTEPEVQYRGAGILSVTGSVSATVQHVERMECRDYRSLIAEIQRLAPQDVLQGSYIGSCSLLTAYCITLCANKFSDKYMPRSEVFPHFQQSLNFLSAILQPGTKQVPDYSPRTHTARLVGYVAVYCTRRSFVTTCEGYMGLAPRNAQPGDQVCVLLGCDVPMLLRPAANSQYEVVGSCYVHGLMDGEALLGPAPEHLQPIYVLDEGKRLCFRRLLDHRTGKTQYNDPRVESLAKDDSDEAVPMVLLPDGSQQRLLTPEMIKKRGVKLQTFDLI